MFGVAVVLLMVLRAEVLGLEVVDHAFFDTQVARYLNMRREPGIMFGYALLLQKGSPNMVVIGSPKRKSKTGSLSHISLCAVNYGKCTKFHLPSTSTVPEDFEFLGATIDGGSNVGDNFVVCAPRASTFPNSYYLNGRCFLFNGSSSVSNITLPVNGNFNQIKRSGTITFYNYAHAEAGMSLNYIQDRNEFIVGAPGLTNWNGGIIRKSLKSDEYDLLPLRQRPTPKYPDAYFGYAIHSGKFERNSDRILYLAGVPRGNKLKGEVVLFERAAGSPEGVYVYRQFYGEQLGAYFGAAVQAVDLDGDGLDDVLVGAPMHAADAWDQGAVYVYQNMDNNKYTFRGPLFGDKKAGSRFGTSIVGLGDLTLNGKKCFAVAAPYEDDGVGAVYIYQSEGEGPAVTVVRRQRLTPAALGYRDVSGFGQGISNAVDLNGDRHNDLAVGAYRSNDVFVLHALREARFEVSFDSVDPPVLQPDTPELTLRYCLQYRASNGLPPPDGNMAINLTLDYRIPYGSAFNQQLPSTGKRLCRLLLFRLKDPGRDFNPLSVSLHVQLGVTEGKADLKIPYTYGCGSDNICQTQLSVTTNLNDTLSLVLGRDRELNLTVFVSNGGETALQCVLVLQLPPDVSLINVRSCDSVNGSYICPIAGRFVSAKTYEKPLMLDVSRLTPETNQVTVDLKVKSRGVDVGGESEKMLNIPVLVENKPYLSGNSEPENVVMNETESLEKNMTFTHHFTLVNSGPSPYPLNVTFYIPEILDKSGGGVELSDLNGGIDDDEEAFLCHEIPCNVELLDSIYNTTEEGFSDTLKDRVVAITYRSKHAKCTAIRCNGTYLSVQQTAKFSFTYLVSKLNIFVEKHEEEFLKRDILTVSTTAFLPTDGHLLITTTPTLLYLPINSSLPLWIAIVTLGIGTICLAIIICVLYKCRFFERSYRAKMQSEMKRLDEEPDSAGEINEIFNEPIVSDEPLS